MKSNIPDPILTRILLAVHTKNKAEKGLPCLEGILYPERSEVKIFNSWGRSLADSYNYIVQTALDDKANYIIFVDENIYPDKNVIEDLLFLAENNPKCAIGAWYPKSKQGNHVVLKNGKKINLDCDDKIHDVIILTFVCTIFPIQIFKDISKPWFKKSLLLSIDTFFSQKIINAGYRLLVDTSIKCGVYPSGNMGTSGVN